MPFRPRRFGIRNEGNANFREIDPPGQIYLQGFVGFPREPAYADPHRVLDEIWHTPVEQGQLSAEYIEWAMAPVEGRAPTSYASFFWVWRQERHDQEIHLRSLVPAETDELVRLLRSVANVRSFAVNEMRKVDPIKLGLLLRKFRLRKSAFEMFDPWDGTTNPSH
jgi:hypothetical protein